VALRFVGVYVVYVPVALVARFVSRVAFGFFGSVSVRRNLRQALQAVPFDVHGQLKYDASGPYLEVETVSGPMRVRVDARDLAPLVFFGKEGRVKESPIATSSAVKSPLPSFQVVFRQAGKVIGGGARVSFGKGGVSGIVTARHVLSGLAEDVTIGTETMEYPMDRSWQVTAMSNRLDVVILAVPDAVLSALRVSQAKAARLPRRGTPVRIYGRYNGDMVYTLGCVSKSQRLRFAHSASTHAGFSGAPIVSNGRVIGVHVSGHGSFNVGVALDWAFKSNLESDTVEQAFREREVNDPDEEFSIWQGGRVKRMRVSKSAYDWDEVSDPDPNEFEDQIHADGRLTWAELAEQDDDFGFDDFGRMESDSPSLKEAGKVREPVQLTEETMSGRREPQVVSKGTVPVCSESVENLESAPVEVEENTPRSPHMSSTQSPLSESGSGLDKTKRRSRGVSKSTPPQGKKEGKSERPSDKQSLNASKKNIREPVAKFGRVPADVRSELRKLGVTFRKGRRTLTESEYASLERAGTGLVLDRAKSFVRGA